MRLTLILLGAAIASLIVDSALQAMLDFMAVPTEERLAFSTRFVVGMIGALLAMSRHTYQRSHL